MKPTGRPPRPSHRPPPPDEAPSLLERAGCFVFIALPLIFGLPIARAYDRLLGPWVLPGYVVAALLLLAFCVYVLEREEP